MTGNLGSSLIMLAAGIGIPIMATLNGALGSRLGSPAMAALILFVVAGTVALTTVTLTRSWPAPVALTTTPLLLFAGGLFVAFYVLSITWLAPRMGVGNAVFFVLLGQLVATAAIDHYAWLGALEFRMTPRRAIGLVLMAIGVFLARRPLQG
ncbi:MAG: DMT family transporter [Pseudomonadota bacterium]